MRCVDGGTGLLVAVLPAFPDLPVQRGWEGAVEPGPNRLNGSILPV